MLTQTQTIRALADALEWFSKEIAWGVSPASLSHLTGRIGELYVAVMTRGQMAAKVGQPGYDVVGAAGDRISVKTITTSTHVTFNTKSFDLVDRVIVLRITVDDGEPSIEEIMDLPADAARLKCHASAAKLTFPIPTGSVAPVAKTDLKIVATGTHGPLTVRQYENGAIEIL